MLDDLWGVALKSWEKSELIPAEHTPKRGFAMGLMVMISLVKEKARMQGIVTERDMEALRLDLIEDLEKNIKNL